MSIPKVEKKKTRREEIDYKKLYEEGAKKEIDYQKLYEEAAA